MINYDQMGIAIIGEETFFSIDQSSMKVTVYYEDEDLVKMQNDYNVFSFPREICSFSLGDGLFDFLAISHDRLIKLSKLIDDGPSWNGYHEQDEIQQFIADFDSIYIYLLYYSVHRKKLGLQYRSRLDRISKEFEFALNFCCNDNFCPTLKQLSSLQRYYLYSKLYTDNTLTIDRYYNRGDYIFLDYDYNNLDGLQQIKKMSKTINRYGEIIDEYEPITELCPIPEETISSLKNAKISLEYRYTHQSIEEYLMEELFTLILLNVRVKQCAYCGRYFILKGDYSTDCCDRIPEGEKYSCKKIMAQKRRKERLKKNPIIQEYERAYKRNYARVANHKMTAEAFRLWTEKATQKRDALSAQYESTPSDQLIADFKQYLGNK